MLNHQFEELMVWDPGIWDRIRPGIPADPWNNHIVLNTGTTKNKLCKLASEKHGAFLKKLVYFLFHNSAYNSSLPFFWSLAQLF